MRTLTSIAFLLLVSWSTTTHADTLSLSRCGIGILVEETTNGPKVQGAVANLQKVLIGDIDRDGEVTSEDQRLLRAHLRRGSSDYVGTFDINLDGVVDPGDSVHLADFVTLTSPLEYGIQGTLFRRDIERVVTVVPEDPGLVHTYFDDAAEAMVWQDVSALLAELAALIAQMMVHQDGFASAAQFVTDSHDPATHEYANMVEECWYGGSHNNPYKDDSEDDNDGGCWPAFRDFMTPKNNDDDNKDQSDACFPPLWLHELARALGGPSLKQSVADLRQLTVTEVVAATQVAFDYRAQAFDIVKGLSELTQLGELTAMEALDTVLAELYTGPLEGEFDDCLVANNTSAVRLEQLIADGHFAPTTDLWLFPTLPSGIQAN